MSRLPDTAGPTVPLRALILDFDGVVVESVGLKFEAFRRLFAVHGDRHAEIMDYLARHNAISRFVKFRYIYEHILQLPYDDAVERRLGEEFSALVFEQVVACPWVPGARELLDEFARVLPIFVVSATPQEELRRIVAARGIADRFAAVLGTPRTKAENVRAVLAQGGYAPDEALSVGDTYEDFEVARSTGVPFVGRRCEHDFADLAAPAFDDLFGVAAELRRRTAAGAGVAAERAGTSHAGRTAAPESVAGKALRLSQNSLE